MIAETGRRGPQEETERLEPRPGNPAAGLCTQPQTAWTPPQGWGEASPTLLDSELCITQRRAATLAAGAGTRARDFYFIIVLSRTDRLHILKHFYYRDIPINSLSLRLLVVFYPLAHPPLLPTLGRATGHQALLGALSSAALDAAVVTGCRRRHPTPAS